MTTVEELKRRDGSIDLARGARDNIRYPVRRGSQTQPPQSGPTAVKNPAAIEDVLRTG